MLGNIVSGIILWVLIYLILLHLVLPAFFPILVPIYALYYFPGDPVLFDPTSPRGPRSRIPVVLSQETGEISRIQSASVSIPIRLLLITGGRYGSLRSA